MRFFFQDHRAKVSTKCLRVSSTATVQQVVHALIERFRPDMKMLSAPSFSLFEVHSNGGSIHRVYSSWGRVGGEERGA